MPRLLAYYDRYPGFGFWAAHTRSGGGFIGWFGLRPVTPTAAAMVHWADADLLGQARLNSGILAARACELQSVMPAGCGP